MAVLILYYIQGLTIHIQLKVNVLPFESDIKSFFKDNPKLFYTEGSLKYIILKIMINKLKLYYDTFLCLVISF